MVEHREPRNVLGERTVTAEEVDATDVVNTRIFHEFKHIDLEEVMRIGNRSFQDLLLRVEATPEEVLTQPASWTQGNTPLEAIPRESYQHYYEHLADVQTLAGVEAYEENPRIVTSVAVSHK